MSKEVKAAIVSSIITGIFSFIIFMAEKDTIEEKTVEILAEYFESVEINMSYEQGLKLVYEDYRKLEYENVKLQNEVNMLKGQINIDEENRTTIENAKVFANLNEYAKALEILNGVNNKTSEMELLIREYSQEYELYIIEQINILLENEELDEANVLVKEALKIISNSQVLKNKQQEIEKAYPKYMTDIVPAYQSGGNTYTEYTLSKGGGAEYFTMGGVKYIYGMTFSADVNIFADVSWAVYNLDKQYNTLEFIVCHVDGTDLGNQTELQIFYDGVLQEEVILNPDMAPKSVSLDVSGVGQLKMQVYPSGNSGPLYGLRNTILR
ncbi:MAG: NPCBM/NEW2 domain-containing protein [Lachnospiraceae bacterium]|nr:NPCBM/NEW2 domain-containing protein [Lachnospiraceae bacterium]